MLKRLASTGINLGVIVLSIAVFLAAFFLLNSMASSQKPSTLRVLAAQRAMSIGDVFTESGLLELEVYADEASRLYIPVAEKEQLLGGIAALPFEAGQPVLRSAVIAADNADSRLSAVLARYGQGSLFPLALDQQSVVAPEVQSFQPGDLVGLTVVMSYRPQERQTPAPTPVFGVLIEPTLLPAQPVVESSTSEADKVLDRGYPPMAKELFPQGVRVIAVQGAPESDSQLDTNLDSTSSSAYQEPGRPILMLLVPDESREVLSLALAQADRVFVSLLSRGSQDATYGWSYWDFEEWFRNERRTLLGETRPLAALPRPTPTPRPARP